MRIIVFFDLPTLTSQDRKNYTVFRKWLIKNGFLMLQESVYSKLALNQITCEAIKDKLKTQCPKQGLVQVLTITETQYNKMEYFAGQAKNNVINNSDRLVMLWN